MSSTKILAEDPHLRDRLILYVDRSTAAYTLEAEGKPVPLSGYQFLYFSERQVNEVLEGIRLSCRAFRWSRPVWKVKPGQINYYCGGTFEERMQLAEFLKAYLVRTDGEIFVMVPSAKSTIDIALRNKSYATRDLLSRSDHGPESLVNIGG